MPELPLKLVKQKDFAALAGVIPQTITKIKKRLGEAVVGRKININHPLAQAYLQERDVKSSDVLNSPGDKSGVQGERGLKNLAKPQNVPEVPDEIANLTLLEIVKLYGGMPGFQQFLTAHTKLADYKNKQLKWELSRQELISKKQEAKVVFEALEQLFKRFVNELPISQAQKVIAIAHENRVDANYQIQTALREMNSNALSICKNRMIKRLGIDRNEELSKLLRKTAPSLFVSDKDDIPYDILS